MTDFPQQRANRLAKVKTSPSMVIAAKAAALKAAGNDIISLSVGEPDFDTPAHIKAAAQAAIDAGKTKYTPLHGTPELREAVVEKFRRDNGLVYQPDQILVTAGGKQGCYNLMMALLNAGDEVIIPAPYWVSYPDMVKLADGEPIIINTTEANGYKLTATQLRESISARTRCLILNSPSNPTGAVYSREELEQLGNVLREFPNITILSDDIYEPIIWSDEPFANLAMACPDLQDRVVIINGVSKAYAMTGWRIGYTAANPVLTQAMATVQSQSTSNACSVSQAAAIAALNGQQESVETMRIAYQQRYALVTDLLSQIPGISMPASSGAFYIFANCEGLIERLPNINNDVELCAHWLEQGVALVPGSAFGTPNCVRFSFAASEAALQEAIKRIRTGLAP